MKNNQSMLIVGASRGLGFALAHEFLKRGWNVVGTVREGKKTQLHDLLNEFKDKLQIETVDITNQDQVTSLKTRLSAKKFDLLFVNAGITNSPTETIGQVSTDEFNHVMVTNALSPMRVIEALTDNVNDAGTIGVMSSGLGSVADNDKGGYEVYRASKASLNTLMRSFAVRRGQKRSLLVMVPGWVKTDMGGPEAPFSIDEVIPLIANTIIAQAGKTGIQYLDRFGKTVRW